VNLPNLLTLSRLVSIPILMVLILADFPYHDQIAAAVFVLASLTDTLDGNLARARGQVTELGKFLDPLADKLFILSVLIVLVQARQLAAWVVVIIFGRELLITVLRSLSASQGKVIAATPWGKTKTVSQVLAVLLLILQQPYPALQPWATVVVGFAVAFTVLSGVDYLWRFRQVLLGGEERWAVAGGGGGGSAGGGASAGGSGGAPPAGEASAELPARDLHRRLAGGRLKVAVAESCTGGLLAAALTDQPGSSAYFNGGVVAYSNEVKESLLGVPAELISRYGAVSAEVAEAMAAGVRRRLGADIGVAVTGIAGPDADGSAKPVGLTHIWVDGPQGSEGRRLEFGGDRWANRRSAVAEALKLLLNRLRPG
jgi:nicotinamide-nucleotide amidase